MARKKQDTVKINAAVAVDTAPVGMEITDEMLTEMLADETAAIEEIESIGLDEPEVEVIEEVYPDSLLGEVVSELEAEGAKIAAYEAQEAGGEILDAPEVGAVEASVEVKPVAEAAPAAKKERAPRLSVDALPVEAFVLTVGDIERDLNEVKAEVLATKPTADKVVEKWENTLTAVHAGKLPSSYTVTTLKALRTAGEITSKDLVATMMSTPVRAGTMMSEGTARAQSSQMMLLLPSLKIAKRDGSKLILNKDSTLAQAIYGLMDAVAPAA